MHSWKGAINSQAISGALNDACLARVGWTSLWVSDVQPGCIEASSALPSETPCYVSVDTDDGPNRRLACKCAVTAPSIRLVILADLYPLCHDTSHEEVLR